MQAAVVSILLMAGACGAQDMPSGNGPPGAAWVNDCGPAPCGPGQGGPAMGSQMQGDQGTGVSRWAPQTPDGVVGYHQGLIWPWYTQIWRIHPQSSFYPGNYAKPYDYREIFNYPWNGPRPYSPAAAPEPAWAWHTDGVRSAAVSRPRQ